MKAETVAFITKDSVTMVCGLPCVFLEDKDFVRLGERSVRTHLLDLLEKESLLVGSLTDDDGDDVKSLLRKCQLNTAGSGEKMFDFYELIN